MSDPIPLTELACLPYGIGANHEGVATLLRIGDYRVLLDCGLWNLQALLADAAEIDLVWCSHAHPDHVRGLLALHRKQPHLPMYASELTCALLPLNYPPDINEALDWVTPLPLRSHIEVKPGLTLSLVPAGHLPGAAILELTYTPQSQNSELANYSVVYTGDMSLSGMRFVEGLELEVLRNLQPHVLILEGSYGTARFPRRRQLENQFIEQICHALKMGQSVLLPVPAIGLGPEILVLLRSHHRLTGQEIEIWVDDDLARSCDLYLDLLSQFPRNIQNFAQYQPLFWDDRVRPWVKRLRDQQKAQLPLPPASIVLVSTETDWWDYCKRYPRDWLVLLSQKPGRTQIESSLVDIQSNQGSHSIQVEPYFLSEHCDVASTLQVIHNLRPQHIVLLHGAPSYLLDLSTLDELSNRYQLHTPGIGNWVELPVGETFHQPAPPENQYEGELTLSPNAIHLTLPIELTLDQRWLPLSNTGLVDIRWQGDQLVLTGLSPADLNNRDRNSNSIRPEFAQLRPMCGNCRYYHGQHCRNVDSPLAGLQVSSDGYCPMYEAQSDGKS